MSPARAALSAAALILLAALAGAAPAGRPAEPLARLAELANPAAPGSGQPGLAADPDGGLWLSWVERRERGGNALRAARLEGRVWTAPVTIAEGESLLALSADVPALLPLGGGRLAALYLWRSPGGGHGRDVWLTHSADGGRTWSAAVRAHDDGTPTEHGFASLVADPAGARAVWLDGRNSSVTDSAGRPVVLEEGIMDMVLRTAVLTPEGALADERVLDPRVCDCCPTAAAAVAGGALVAYRDRGDDELRDISLVRLRDGRWDGPRAVHHDGWRLRGCPVNGPALAVAGTRVAVGWYTMADDTARVRVAVSEDGGARFAPPVAIDLGAPVGRVALAALPGGAFVAAWFEADGGALRLVARRISSAGVPGPPAAIAPVATTRGSGMPRVALAGDRVVFAWTEPGRPSRLHTAMAPVAALR